MEIGPGAPETPAPAGPLDLLVIQATPFCNLDCHYCYLPDRENTARMSPAVLDRLFARVFESELVGAGGFTVVWHAGEPLVLPARVLRGGLRHRRAPQPRRAPRRPLLPDQRHPDRRRLVRLHRAPRPAHGVSVDGPAFLHDRQRVTRRGRGTHGRVMEGIGRLRRHGIPFHVITVLTREALDYPDELYDVLRGARDRARGLQHRGDRGPPPAIVPAGPARPRADSGSSSRASTTSPCGRRSPLRVREFDSMLGTILHGAGVPPRAQETTPFAILSVDYQGRFTSFSPELLGLTSARYGDFFLGNVATDSLADAARSPRFAAIHRDITAGVDRVPARVPVLPLLWRRRARQQALRERLVRLHGNPLLPAQPPGSSRRAPGQADRPPSPLPLLRGGRGAAPGDLARPDSPVPERAALDRSHPDQRRGGGASRGLLPPSGLAPAPGGRARPAPGRGRAGPAPVRRRRAASTCLRTCGGSGGPAETPRARRPTRASATGRSSTG